MHAVVLSCNEFFLLFLRKLVGTPSKRAGHSSFVAETTKLFVFGGSRDDTKWFNDLHVLDVARQTESTKNLLCNLKKLVGDPEFADVTL